MPRPILFFLSFAVIVSGLFLTRLLTSPVTTKLRAEVDTHGVCFIIDQNWKDTAGLFNSEVFPLDVTIQNESKLVSGQGNEMRSVKVVAQRILPNVKLSWLDISQGTTVKMTAEGGRLRMQLQRWKKHLGAIASLEITDATLAALRKTAGDTDFRTGPWSIVPDDGKTLSLTIHIPDSTGESATNGADWGSEPYVPLATGSQILFKGKDNQAALVGGKNSLILYQPQREIDLGTDLLEVKRLSPRASLRSVVLQIAASQIATSRHQTHARLVTAREITSIHLVLTGASPEICLGTPNPCLNEAATAGQSLMANRNFQTITNFASICLAGLTTIIISAISLKTSRQSKEISQQSLSVSRSQLSISRRQLSIAEENLHVERRRCRASRDNRSE